MTKTFKIDPRTNGGDMFQVEAETHAQAATIGARKIFRKFHVVGLRQTGDASGSGMFQAYWKNALGTQSSYGNMFHVAES